MPIYDYKCECGEEKKDEFVFSWDTVITCDKCKKPMIKLFSGFRFPHTFPKNGIFLEHVSPEGKLFHSKKEMKDYAKKHDLQLGALE